MMFSIAPAVFSLVFLSCEEEEKEPRIEGTEVGDCTDGADNDGDGDFDCDDSGCAGSPDCAEADTDTDTDADTDADTDTDVPLANLRIQLTWTVYGDDLDLHLLNGYEDSDLLGTDQDCHYQNCTSEIAPSGLDWGELGNSDDNPRLTLQDTEGIGPEQIEMTDPNPYGVYTIYVHDYDTSSGASESNLATLRVFSGDTEIWSKEIAITGEGSYTPVATIEWETRGIIPL